MISKRNNADLDGMIEFVSPIIQRNYRDSVGLGSLGWLIEPESMSSQTVGLYPRFLRVYDVLQILW